MRVFPFVLKICADDVDSLVCPVIIPERNIFQVVEIILQSGGELRGHKKKTVEFIGILPSAYCGEVPRPSISLRIHPRAIVTFATDVLCRDVCVPQVLAVLTLAVITEGTAVVCMLRLLGDERLVCRTVQTVSSSPILFDGVILKPDFRKWTHPDMSSCADRDGVYRRNFRKSVSVSIVAVSTTPLSKDEKPSPAVVGNHRSVKARVVVKSPAYPDRSELMAYSRTRTQGFLGDDVDCSSNGGSTEKRRTSTTHHLDTINHRCGNLFQAIHAGKSREYGPGVNEDL